MVKTACLGLGILSGFKSWLVHFLPVWPLASDLPLWASDIKQIDCPPCSASDYTGWYSSRHTESGQLRAVSVITYSTHYATEIRYSGILYTGDLRMAPKEKYSLINWQMGAWQKKETYSQKYATAGKQMRN